MNQKRGFRISFNSPVILGFTVLCFGAMLLGMITRNTSTHLVFSVYRDRKSVV